MRATERELVCPRPVASMSQGRALYTRNGRAVAIVPDEVYGASEMCGGALEVDGAIRCRSCGARFGSLADLARSGRSRARQHAPGGFPDRPVGFR